MALRQVFLNAFPFLEKPVSGLERKIKSSAELAFWKKELSRYDDWYAGRLPELYGKSSPRRSPDGGVAALLTWLDVHQKPKYLQDLMLGTDAFTGLKVLDIGSGPLPSALAFEDAEVYCLDPLLRRYIEAGFPTDLYDRARFVCGSAESVPFPNSYFDVVISVNAIDHVDDFEQAAQEIGRVMKPGGKLRLHVHYHPGTIAEPIELNDARMAKAFDWEPSFRKISESKSKRGTTLTLPDEFFTVWSNF